VRAGGGAGGRIVRIAAPANDNGPAMARFGRLALRLCVVLAAAAAALIALLR
jgi:hypothetical protein